MPEGYEVVPAALRQAQQAFDTTADNWDSLREKVTNWKLGDNDLGLLGRLAGVVQDYNGGATAIAEKLQTGAVGMHTASDTLNTVAAAYEQQDAKYYGQFGWTQQQMDSVYQPE